MLRVNKNFGIAETIVTLLECINCWDLKSGKKMNIRFVWPVIKNLYHLFYFIFKLNIKLNFHF